MRCAAPKLTHMVAFNYRHTPAVALARKMIDEGRIGTVLNFRGTYLQDWSANPDGPLSWRFQKKIAGSGAVGDIGTHVIDLARYLVGDIAAVNAITKTYVTERPQQNSGVDRLGASGTLTGVPKAAVDVDDEMLTLLRFASGAVGSIEATRNAYGRNNYLTFEIHGTTGSICFNYERRDELQVMFAERPGRQPWVSHHLHRPGASVRRRAVANPCARHRLRRDQDHRGLPVLQGDHERRIAIA